jgi:hypothetical protein
MGKGWTPLRWLLQPFTTGMVASSGPARPTHHARSRVTRALEPDQAPVRLDAAAQAAVDTFVARLVADYEPAPFVIEAVLEPMADTADQRQVILLYPKGLRRDGESRRCEELTVAVLPAGASALGIHQTGAVAHAMVRQIERRLSQDAGWVDAELEAGLKLGFPADWRDYRFVG